MALTWKAGKGLSGKAKIGTEIGETRIVGHGEATEAEAIIQSDVGSGIGKDLVGDEIAETGASESGVVGEAEVGAEASESEVVENTETKGFAGETIKAPKLGEAFSIPKTNTIIPEGKLEYLLKDTGKSPGFKKLGYTSKVEVKNLLVEKGTQGTITEIRVNKYGTFIRLERDITGKVGTQGKLATVWKIDANGHYKFITGWVKVFTKP